MKDVAVSSNADIKKKEHEKLEREKIYINTVYISVFLHKGKSDLISMHRFYSIHALEYRGSIDDGFLLSCTLLTQGQHTRRETR